MRVPMRIFKWLQIVFIMPLFAYAQFVDIIDLHHNTSQGLPAPPYAIGAQVSIRGVATVGTGTYSLTNFEIYVQDQTAAINVFVYNSIPQIVNPGDSVLISGKIDQYRGLTEIGDVTEAVVTSSNNPVPEPLVLSCQDVANSFQSDYSEPNEGRLIRINNVHVTNSSSPSFTITDSTGSCILFIDPDTNLPLPQGVFDVIGILKQYDSTEPLSGGYEISPRFISDFIQKNGPILTEQPHEVDINTTSVAFSWTTKTEASTLFKFGESESYELGAIGDSSMVHNHIVTISGLNPATIYQGRAVSSDASGSVQSENVVFSTSSEESSGEIQVYFTRSVETNYANTEYAHGNTDLSQKIIGRMNQAKYSLDVCLYSLSHLNITFAIKNAHDRGVSVRIIHEDENGSDDFNFLRDAGIPIITDKFGNNSGQGYMHNKFVIIDHRGDSNGADDWLWTGSANASYPGSTDNGENMLLFQDETLCAAYTREFNEMWGSETETPNAVDSKFSNRKVDNTPHRFVVGGTWIEQYMSPSDNTENKIINAINTADQSIFFCIYSFTSNSIEKALQDKYYNLPEFWLRGVFDKESIGNYGAAYPDMVGEGAYAWSPPADVHLDALPKLLHHKYLIADASLPDSDPLVETGSHNWSISANTKNDENTLIIHSERIANLYLQEFAARYHEAGGSGDLVTGISEMHDGENSVPMNYSLYQNYPNPFNGTTIIPINVQGLEKKDKIQIEIKNILGRVVRRINVQYPIIGVNRVKWDGKDDFGNSIVSGVYFCSLSGSVSRTIKMLYLK